MRFLFLTQYFPPEVGAPQVRLAAIVRQLTLLGHEVEVVTAMPNYPSGRIQLAYRGKFYCREDWEGAPVHRVWVYAATGAGIRRFLTFISFVFTALLGLFRARRPDFIFVNSPPLFVAIPGWLASVAWRRPLILTIADLWPDSVTGLGLMKEGAFIKAGRVLERWAYRRARYVTAVTEGIREILIKRKGVPEAKVLFMPNGVDTDLFTPRPPDRDLQKALNLNGERVILYAGTYGYAHGIEVALESARRLQNDHVRFIFIGDGPERDRIDARVRELGVGNIMFLDPAPHEYVSRLFTLSYAGLSTLKDSPLFYDRRPAKMFPIMASGKPVLYSGAGEGARLVENAEAGIVTPPEDAGALTAAIRDMVSNPQAAERMGRNGRRFVEENLAWKGLVVDWLRQLDEREAARRGAVSD